MPRRRYGFVYSGTVELDEKDIVEFALSTMPPVQIQDPPETVTEEVRLRADLAITESIAAIPDIHLRLALQRLIPGFLSELRGMFPTATVTSLDVELSPEES